MSVFVCYLETITKWLPFIFQSNKRSGSGYTLYFCCLVVVTLGWHYYGFGLLGYYGLFLVLSMNWFFQNMTELILIRDQAFLVSSVYCLAFRILYLVSSCLLSVVYCEISTFNFLMLTSALLIFFSLRPWKTCFFLVSYVSSWYCHHLNRCSMTITWLLAKGHDKKCNGSDHVFPLLILLQLKGSFSYFS